MTLLRNLFGLTLIAACVLAPASAQPAGYDRAWDGPVDGTEDWFD